MNRVVHATVFSLLGIPVSTAFCQPPGGRGPEDRGLAGRGPGSAPNAVLAALDVNSDHEISTRELLAAAASLKKLDKNGDGKLTRDELHPEVRSGRPGFGPQGGPEGRVGRGADGRGDRRPAGLGPEGRGPGGGRGGPGGPPSGEQFVEDALGFDADQDGKLSKDELLKFAEQFMRGPRGGGPGTRGGRPDGEQPARPRRPASD